MNKKALSAAQFFTVQPFMKRIENKNSVTQYNRNLCFLKLYIKKKNGNTIKNIDALSKVRI